MHDGEHSPPAPLALLYLLCHDLALLLYDSLVVNPLAVLAVLRRALGILTAAPCASLLKVAVAAAPSGLRVAEHAALTGLAEVLVPLLVVECFAFTGYEGLMLTVKKRNLECLSDWMKILHCCKPLLPVAAGVLNCYCLSFTLQRYKE